MEEIVEFSKDDASDVETLIQLLEQCLSQKLNLNVKSLDVGKMRIMLDETVRKVKEHLNVDGIDDPAHQDNQGRIQQLLMEPMAQNLHLKVKRLIRGYFEELWQTETGLLKTKHETEKTMQNVDDTHD